ncbi:hypothetical protein, partial [Akkermansia sp.]|uniref:hypothetical protein n=1 Tax=Akkermansia sp. TaxID=1872421 RepID=UPI003AAF4D78
VRHPASISCSIIFGKFPKGRAFRKENAVRQPTGTAIWTVGRQCHYCTKSGVAFQTVFTYVLGIS